MKLLRCFLFGLVLIFFSALAGCSHVNRSDLRTKGGSASIAMPGGNIQVQQGENPKEATIQDSSVSSEVEFSYSPPTNSHPVQPVAAPPVLGPTSPPSTNKSVLPPELVQMVIQGGGSIHFSQKVGGDSNIRLGASQKDEVGAILARQQKKAQPYRWWFFGCGLVLVLGGIAGFYFTKLKLFVYIGEVGIGLIILPLIPWWILVMIGIAVAVIHFHLVSKGIGWLQAHKEFSDENKNGINDADEKIIPTQRGPAAAPIPPSAS